jgi:hypothetical protein
MPLTETQIEIYALTKKLLELSEKYLLAILPHEKILLLEQINITYDKLDKLKIIYKEETK